MKVLHVIPSMSPRFGGPVSAMAEIEQALHRRGVDVVVATTDSNGPDRLAVECGRPIAGPAATRWYFRRTTRFYTLSLDLWRWLMRNVGEFDVVHIHALFTFASLAAAWAAKSAGVPYIVRPLGVLAPYGMTHRRQYLKKLSLSLVERRVLEGAEAVHFTSSMEADEMRPLALNIKSIVIPLGIDTDANDGVGQRIPPQEQLRLLFLSRIDPKKNLMGAIDALSIAGHGRDVRLTIAGGGAPDYVHALMEKVERAGLADRVEWLGHVDGLEKRRALEAAHAFILPSFSENFGMAVVEALAAGLPCIVSRGVAIAGQVANANAGIVTGTDPQSIAAAIEMLVADPERYLPMSYAARKLAVEAFSREGMGARLEELYRNVIAQHASAGGQAPPRDHRESRG